MTLDFSITVLGIHDGHNAGAALVRDGVVIAAINEERLNNIKNYSGSPLLSIPKVLEIARIDGQQVDLIAVVGLLRTSPPIAKRTLFDEVYERSSPYFRPRVAVDWTVRLAHRFRNLTELRHLSQKLGMEGREMVFVEHHQCHVACAYYPRPWSDRTLVLTLDGSGDGLCATVSIGDGVHLERIASSIYYDSPSNVMYSEITAYLGMKPWEHEYKVMGLAPYGRAEYCLKEMQRLVRVNPGRPLEFQNISGTYLPTMQRWLHKRLAGQRFDNIAAACQTHFEQVVCHWVKNCIEETGIRKIACAGGSFLNVKANKLLREMPEVEATFFYPAADDGGTPVGAALEAYYRLCAQTGLAPRVLPLADVYYGAQYTDQYIERALHERGWLARARFTEAMEGEIASLLARGRIVARFSGRDEWGPRALGNRSILADPRDPGVIRRLNFAIKQRDFWMPFAPSILEEYAPKYLVSPKPTPYMIEAFDTTEHREDIIAGIHPMDFTARPQTVNDWNPGYRRLLEAFAQETGVGGVLNTSFNLHGYPIVGSPEVALDTFERSGLDALALGHWLLVKEQR